MRICNHINTNKFTLFLLILIGSVFAGNGFGQGKSTTKNSSATKTANDSTHTNTTDSIKLNEKKNKKTDRLDAQVDYSAQDSIVLLGNGTGFLYGKSDVKYKKTELKADFIRVRMDSSLVYARGSRDSVGNKIGDPEFSEGQDKYGSREMTYNLRTKKGYIRQAVTQQGEGYIISDITKRTQDENLCIKGGKYTTCDNHDHPDFYLSLSRGKVKPGEYVVSGPAHLVVEDVPLPIYIPFGFYPFTNKYSSGILMPTFRDDYSRGFGLSNGGYYFAFNDYMDLELRSEIYTKGTWALNGISTYRKKYKYNGSFNINYREDITGEKDESDYSVAKNFSVRWSHSQDQKANPNMTLSASVNFSTSGYNRSNINSTYNSALYSENQKSSSISFTKKFDDNPFTLSGNVLVNQSTRDSTISMTLPNLTINMSRVYPFKRKNAVGKEHWYEKIYMSYSGTFANSITTKENKLMNSSFSRDWRNGIKHSIPVTATFNVLKYINVSPSFTYTERWYSQKYNQSWNETSKVIRTDTITGFYRVYDFTTGVSASTKLYGFYKPSPKIFGQKIQGIRHMMTLSMGFGYTPDFSDPIWGYYGTYLKQTATDSKYNSYQSQTVQYSHFANSLYGSPGAGKSGSISYSIINNLEMKVRNDNDTTGTESFIKKSLIDNFSINGSYNLAADSMRWSNISTSLRIKLTKSYTLSLSTTWDPYMYGISSSGTPVRTNRLRWNYGRFPTFLGTGTSYSYTFNNDTFNKLFGKEKDKSKDGKKDDSQKNSQTLPTKDTMKDDKSKEKDKENKDNKKNELDTDGYQKLTLPWSISFNYSVSCSRSSALADFNKETMEYKLKFNQGLGFSGNVSLTNNWKINGSTNYSFDSKSFPYSNISIVRNLHCWTMSGTIALYNKSASYTFHLAVNASMLQDLKYDKQSGYGSTPITWY